MKCWTDSYQINFHKFKLFTLHFLIDSIKKSNWFILIYKFTLQFLFGAVLLCCLALSLVCSAAFFGPFYPWGVVLGDLVDGLLFVLVPLLLRFWSFCCCFWAMKSAIYGVLLFVCCPLVQGLWCLPFCLVLPVGCCVWGCPSVGFYSFALVLKVPVCGCLDFVWFVCFCWIVLVSRWLFLIKCLCCCR